MGGPLSLFRSLLGSAAEAYADVAGSRLESDRLPPDDHRPWPVPKEPWVVAQTWHDLAFMHWPVPKPQIDALLPSPLTADTFEGTAWIGVTPFHMSGVRARGLPAVPGFSAFQEINVRTYVTVEDKPGVAFFSLDADTAAGVLLGRSWYSLPYYFATGWNTVRSGRFRFCSERDHSQAPPAQFVAAYRPVAAAAPARAGSLEWWLTERYCLYAVDADGRLSRAEIHHAPWPLQRAEAEIELNTMARPLGIDLSPAPALAHFASRLEVSIWPPRQVGAGERAA